MTSAGAGGAATAALMAGCCRQGLRPALITRGKGRGGHWAPGFAQQESSRHGGGRKKRGFVCEGRAPPQRTQPRNLRLLPRAGDTHRHTRSALATNPQQRKALAFGLDLLQPIAPIVQPRRTPLPLQGYEHSAASAGLWQVHHRCVPYCCYVIRSVEHEVQPSRDAHKGSPPTAPFRRRWQPLQTRQLAAAARRRHAAQHLCSHAASSGLGPTSR